MPFLRVEFNLEALRKLAERNLSVDEITELFRTDASRWVIGPTNAGRFVTAVVERDSQDHGLWHVMTAWDATPTQINIYRNAK